MIEDAALAEEARNGNAAAFVKLAKRWWTPLYRVSWNISGSALCAAEITERTLLAAIHSVEPSPFTRVPFKVFLYRVAVRLTLTREPPASTGRKPQDALGTIREVLQRLDPLDRAALVLRETEQLPVEEVAAILSASEEVRIRIHRAILSLARSVGRSPGQTRYQLQDELEARGHRTRRIRSRLWIVVDLGSACGRVWAPAA
jgi:DNA-directed RNA polymerase specialized sigma24 family protein